MENERRLPPFTSCQSKWERILAIGYLPVHIVLAPLAAELLLRAAGVSVTWLNFSVYAVGAVFMLASQWRFLRRDFDTLCDGFLGCAVQVLSSYGAMLCFNLAVSGILVLILGDEGVSNPNNQSVTELTRVSYGPTAALAIFMAPILEELMFRAGIFGTLRKYSRTAAYIVSMLAFSLYHVWAFALEDPKNLVYMIQYLPISFLLCRCYERSSTIWTPIFLHMTVNAVSISVLGKLGAL